MRTSHILLIASCLSACNTVSTPLPTTPERAPTTDDEEEPITRVRATLSGDALHVELELRTDWIPRGAEGVELLFENQTMFERAPHGFSEFLYELDAQNERTPWTGRFASRDGIVRARWEVRLEHHTHGPVYGLDDVPHPTRGGWVLIGRAFVPRAMRLWDGRTIETPVELSIISDGDVIGSLPEDDAHIFSGATLAQVADAMYVTGRFHTQELRHGDTRITLVTSDFEEAALSTMSDMISRMFAVAEPELGPVPAGDLFVVHDRNPRGIDGSVTGRAISILSESGPSGRALADDGIVLVHELVHLWNRSDTWWINEGFARWWEVRFCHVLDDSPPSEIGATLARVWQRYMEEAAGRTIEASNGSFGYAAGALLAFCAETRLRQNGTSLGVVHRAAREASTPTPTSTIRRDAFMAALEAAMPAARAEIEQRLEAEGPVDFTDCFSRAGLRLTENGEVVEIGTPEP